MVEFIHFALRFACLAGVFWSLIAMGGRAHGGYALLLLVSTFMLFTI